MGRETPPPRVGEGVASEGEVDSLLTRCSLQLSTAKHMIRKENEYEGNDETQ